MFNIFLRPRSGIAAATLIYCLLPTLVAHAFWLHEGTMQCRDHTGGPQTLRHSEFELSLFCMFGVGPPDAMLTLIASQTCSSLNYMHKQFGDKQTVAAPGNCHEAQALPSSSWHAW